MIDNGWLGYDYYKNSLYQGCIAKNGDIFLWLAVIPAKCRVKEAYILGKATQEQLAKTFIEQISGVFD
jgi:hypothetical protein